MIYTISHMEINEWVRTARKHKGWNQTELGDVVGRTKGNIGHWETGKHTPGIHKRLLMQELSTPHPKIAG